MSSLVESPVHQSPSEERERKKESEGEEGKGIKATPQGQLLPAAAFMSAVFHGLMFSNKHLCLCTCVSVCVCVYSSLCSGSKNVFLATLKSFQSETERVLCTLMRNGEPPSPDVSALDKQ